MDAVRACKFKQYHAAFDADGDGVLTRADFVLAAERFSRALGHADGSVEAGEVRDKTVAFWTDTIAPMDGDGDGVVTCQELADSLERSLGVDRATYAAQVRPVADAYFDLAGPRSGDHLAPEEFIRLANSACRVPERDGAQIFRELDGDGSGALSREAFHEALVEFFYGTDPDAPANHLFGRLQN